MVVVAAEAKLKAFQNSTRTAETKRVSEKDEINVPQAKRRKKVNLDDHDEQKSRMKEEISFTGEADAVLLSRMPSLDMDMIWDALPFASADS
ncbi:hypothetical protein J5N97_007353 [Dioscorea zingiberensis]|uniref:Uncharacterized protein n=1 Tax=Dioscorea zingiberensis TaxID=325984 RepID=A0A9D5HV30_9LILI|nr:hypothetical protein J5N97_007353 [Dioscorea zingiberensis]